MRGFILLAYCCFLFLTGNNSYSFQPASLSHSPTDHIEKSHPLDFANTGLFVDEMEDEDERINNALAKKCRLLARYNLLSADIFDLNYLNGFTKDRLMCGDLPDIYITQRALRI
jgi:hypothetical protein